MKTSVISLSRIALIKKRKTRCIQQPATTAIKDLKRFRFTDFFKAIRDFHRTPSNRLRSADNDSVNSNTRTLYGLRMKRMQLQYCRHSMMQQLNGVSQGRSLAGDHGTHRRALARSKTTRVPSVFTSTD
jgi:hypothetical protein